MSIQNDRRLQAHKFYMENHVERQIRREEEGGGREEEGEGGITLKTGSLQAHQQQLCRITPPTTTKNNKTQHKHVNFHLSSLFFQRRLNCS